MRSPRVLWVFLALILVSCRDTPTGSDLHVEPGRFEITLSGAISAEVHGVARIESDVGSRSILLHTGDHSLAVSFTPPIFGSSGFDFRVGTYSISSVLGGGALDVTLNTSPAYEDFFIGTSGTLRITESMPESVVAEFDFQALADPAGTRKQIRARGAFHAIPAQ